MWLHSDHYTELMRRRVARLEAEMVCAAQLREELAPVVSPGMSLLDAGCGPGHYYWSLRSLGIEYHGIDPTPHYIALGRQFLAKGGLPPERLQVVGIEELTGTYDVVVCYNVLQYLPDYREALGVLCSTAERILVIRTLLDTRTCIRYEQDPTLGDALRDARFFFNIYAIGEVSEFIRSRGFTVRRVADRRSGDAPEMVLGMPHPYRILFCERDRRPR
ncbi:MAG: class I SAM-dependent methyltransferase [Candidatus Rokubacteria bacterium]|nr:class I SAM-dependent methyltransferase [Candidatus Rokubacteria bacterium]